MKLTSKTNKADKFYKKKRYYVLLIFLFIILNIHRCINPNSKLPQELRLIRLSKEFYHPHYIYVYKVFNRNLEFNNISCFHVRCDKHFKDCNTFDWINCSELEDQISSDIKRYLFYDYESETIIKLDSLISNGDFYFSGCYTASITNQGDTNRFWEYRFYIDPKNKILYVIDYSEDF